MWKKVSSSISKILKKKEVNDSNKLVNIVTGGNLDLCDKFANKYNSFFTQHSFPQLLILKESDDSDIHNNNYNNVTISGDEYSENNTSKNHDQIDNKYKVIERKNIKGINEMYLSYKDTLSMNTLFNYLEKNNYKINCILHLNHTVLLDIPVDYSEIDTFSNGIENERIIEMLKQIKFLIKTNIENPFILNNNLLNRRHLLNKTKICHFTNQNPFAVNISKYLKYNKIFIDMFNLLKSKHSDAIKNKEVDIKLINIHTIDPSYIEYYKTFIDTSIKNDSDFKLNEIDQFKENISIYEKNIDKALDFLIYMCDPTNNIKKITIDIDNI